MRFDTVNDQRRQTKNNQDTETDTKPTKQIQRNAENQHRLKALMIQGGTIQVKKRETEMVRDVIEELTAYSTLPLHSWSFQYTHSHTHTQDKQ